MAFHKTKIVAIGIGLILIVLLILFSRTPYWTALVKSRSHFIAHKTEKRVYFEAGAEAYADQLAVCLSAAVDSVEGKHFAPFPDPFNVYVCATQESFDEFTANTTTQPIRGTAVRGNIFIAPSAFDFFGKDTHCETLAHELSHLHFQQKLGFVQRRKIPQWFHEGFADHVAHSGGEGIEEEAAIYSILHGEHFIPVEEGAVFGSFQAALNGLSGPMFHQQSKMFVTYILAENPAKFKSFILKIQAGESFSNSFRELFETDVAGKWAQFVSHLKSTIGMGE